MIAPPDQEVRIAAVMTVPRYGSMAARGVIEQTLAKFGIPLHTTQGVFWHQQLASLFDEYLDSADWILTIDYDSMFSPGQLDQLFRQMVLNTGVDALAALQMKRQCHLPLLGVAEGVVPNASNQLQPVHSAHFGLTVLRTEALAKVHKPWFEGIYDDHGDWCIDPDIAFWNAWRASGNTLCVDPQVSIGHLEETVAIFDSEDNYAPKHMTVVEWRERYLCE